MDIRIFTPPPKLAKFVKYYYYIENAEDKLINDTFFADGCVEAVFSLGWEFDKDGKLEEWAKIIGQIIEPRKLRIRGKGRSFGIWFYPHTFSHFAGVEMSEMNDSVLSWDTIFPNSLAEFVGNCMCDGELDQLVDGMNDFLLARLETHKTSRIDEMIDAAIDYLVRHRGDSDLDQLAGQLNVSHRYLQRGFLTRVGFSQKFFLRVMRFQDTLRTLTQGNMATLTEVGHSNQFYDQSHFIREFKAFAGFTPSEFRSVRLPINQHFLAVD